jgi:glycerol uptake facilitator-like aquaporin
MYNTQQKMVAEFIGTFTLILAGVGAVCANQLAGGGSGLGRCSSLRWCLVGCC